MRKKTYMTTRSAIYMCMLILTILLVPVCDGDKILQVMLILATVIIWSVTLRFIERPFLIPLNMLFNTALVALPSAVPYFKLGTEYFAAMLPLAAGLTALTSMNADKSSSYGRPDVSEELIIPSSVGFAVGTASCSVYILTGHKTVSAGIILAALLLMVISALIRKFTGKDVIFSSYNISDIRNIPSDDKANLKSFIVHRAIACVSAVIIEVALIFSVKIPPIHPLDMFDLKPFVCAIVSAILALIFHKKIGEKSFGGGFFPYEMIFSFGILVIPLLIGDPVLKSVAVPLSPVLFSLSDMLVTGFLCTYKRRRLSSVRHSFSEGVPLLLMTSGILVMAVEVFAHLVV